MSKPNKLPSWDVAQAQMMVATIQGDVSVAVSRFKMVSGMKLIMFLKDFKIENTFGSQRAVQWHCVSMVWKGKYIQDSF